MKKFNEFLTEKGITKEQFESKSAEEMANLYNDYNAANSAELKSLIESVETKASETTEDAIKVLKNEIQEARVEQMKSLNETLKQHGLAIKKLTEEEKSSKPETGTLRDALAKHAEDIKNLREKGGKVVFKAPATMLISTNVSGGNVPVEQRLPGFNTIASRRIRLMDVTSRGTATSNVISWVYQANKDGAAGQTAEGAVKNQIDFDLVVASESVKKTTAYIKISDEMKDDIDFMTSEINNELTRELLKAVEAQVYEGDGTGNNLNGIRTTATAFAAGTFAGTVNNANLVDVLVVAMNQIKIAEHDAPNYIFLHPSDVTALKLIKVGSTDDRYIDRLQLVAGQMTLDGVPIIETTLVTQDEYLVGSFDLATVYDKGAPTIEMGLDSDDFTKNLMTIRAEWRGLVIVKNNDRTAFVAGDFTTDKAALETP